MSTSFWQQDSLVTLILFELCQLWYLAQSQILVTSLYVVPVKSKVKISQNFVAFSEYMNFTKTDDRGVNLMEENLFINAM